MKKLISLICVVLLCMSLCGTAFAAEAGDDMFVPSIGYKDGPGIIKAILEGEDVTACLVMTSLKQADDKTTDLSQEDRDILLNLYKQVRTGKVKLPTDKSYVISEMVDLSWRAEGCVGGGHDHKHRLSEDGKKLIVDLDMGVEAGLELMGFVYIDGEWIAIEKIVNNGDGTISCEMEDICPLVFYVGSDVEGAATEPDSGDESNIAPWIAALGGSAVAAAALVLNRKKLFKGN